MLSILKTKTNRFCGSLNVPMGNIVKHSINKLQGRAMKRIKYNRRFVNVVVGMGKKKSPNSQ